MLDMNEWSNWRYLNHGVFFINEENFTVEKLRLKHMEVIVSLDKDNKLNYKLTKIFVEHKNGRVDIINYNNLYPTAKEAMVALYPHLKEKTAQHRAWFNHYLFAFYNSKQKDVIIRNWKTVKSIMYKLRYLKQRLKHCYRITGIEEVKNIIDLTDETVLSVKSQLPDHAYMELEAVYAGKNI